MTQTDYQFNADMCRDPPRRRFSTTERVVKRGGEIHWCTPSTGRGNCSL